MNLVGNQNRIEGYSTENTKESLSRWVIEPLNTTKEINQTKLIENYPLSQPINNTSKTYHHHSPHNSLRKIIQIIPIKYQIQNLLCKYELLRESENLNTNDQPFNRKHSNSYILHHLDIAPTYFL